MNAATTLATVLASELSRCGVDDIVVAPGARSGPLAQALFLEADRSGQRLHVRFDERAAGFLALGLAKRSRQPVAVVCTSGTAIANLHPAVLEASHSHLPLIVLSADRPPELRSTGASQTTDQTKIFNSAVRFFAEVGMPCFESGIPSANSYWRSLVCRAIASSASGPVHLNVPFPEPLDFAPADAADPRFTGRPTRGPWIDVTERPASVDVPSTAVIPPGTNGVVVVGDGAADPAAAVRFAEAMGWPLLAEPQSGARTGPNAITTYRYLLGHAATCRHLQPDVALCVGRPGISRELQALLRNVSELIVVDPHDDWADPTRAADRLLRQLPTPTGLGADSCWLEHWRSADEIALAALDRLLDDSALSEPRLIRDVLTALPGDALCFIGSSMPIRDADVTMPPRQGLRVLCNRGLAGIDGTTSTAIGAAIAHQAAGGGKAVAIVGDLTFLHDITGLISSPASRPPDLTIIVINNRGGGIFSLVDYTSNAVGFDELFATPHAVDVASLAAGTGWSHRVATCADSLITTLADAGPGIIEVRTERAANAALHRRLTVEIHQALAEGTRMATAKIA